MILGEIIGALTGNNYTATLDIAVKVLPKNTEPPMFAVAPPD